MRAGRAAVLFARGDLKKAKIETKLVIKYWSRIGEKTQQTHALWDLALIGETENDLHSAVAHAEKALKLAEESGIREDIAVAFGPTLLGIFKYKQGNVQEGMKHIRDGLSLLQKGEIGEIVAADTFVHLAGFLIKKKTQVAVQILAFADSLMPSSALRKDAIWNKPYFERFLSVTRAKLSNAEFAAAWEAGSKMTVYETIDLALKTLDEM